MVIVSGFARWSATRLALGGRAFAAGPESEVRGESTTAFAGTAFHDALRDGSVGPEMVRVGGGSFRMGPARDEVG